MSLSMPQVNRSRFGKKPSDGSKRRVMPLTGNP